ncbi:MAG TPA: hypothetical protein VGS02_06905 [Acidobacteriaceae bacterium]|nr:hypothetical protein [Acidobacteriaceae bacterium]
MRRLLGHGLRRGQQKSAAKDEGHPEEEWSYQRALLPAMMEQFSKQAQLCRRRSILAIGHHSS